MNSQKLQLGTGSSEDWFVITLDQQRFFTDGSDDKKWLIYQDLSSLEGLEVESDFKGTLSVIVNHTKTDHFETHVQYDGLADDLLLGYNHRGLLIDRWILSSANKVEERVLSNLEYSVRNLVLGTEQLLYTTVLIRQNKILKRSQMSTHPLWMKKLKEKIGKLSFNQLVIPGSHQSAASRNDRNARILDGTYLCQSTSLLAQLNMGSRCLDMRVELRTDGVFILEHYFYLMDLEHALQQVLTFVKRTGEVVFLDFHTHKHFNEDTHFDRFYLCVENIFRDLLVYPPAMCLNDCYRSLSAVVICLDKSFKNPPAFNHGSILQLWANSMDPDKILSHNKKALNEVDRESGRIFSNNLQCTRHGWSYIIHPCTSIQKLALKFNRRVPSFVRENFDKMNVAIVDYFLSSLLVETIISCYSNIG